MRHRGSTLFAVLLFNCGLYAQAPKAPRALVYEREAWVPGAPIGRVPEWNGSLLVGCDPCQAREPILYMIDRQDRRDELVFELPGSGYIYVGGIGSGPDGALVVVGFGMSDDSRMASFIAWISPDRKRQIVTRTWPYLPFKVTVATDGTIWTVGPVRNGYNTATPDPNVIRHYDSSGHLLASASVNARPDGNLVEVSSASRLMASSDRIGWLTGGCEYIEFSFDANELGRYNCPSGMLDGTDMDGVALSAGNSVVLGGKRNTPFAPLELNRAKRTWEPVPVPTDAARNWHLILGFDGLSLVTFAHDPGSGKLRRFGWGTDAAATGSR